MSKAKAAEQRESDDKDVQFRCVAPGAQSVFLAGTFNSWDPAATPMQSGQSGAWQVGFALSPGRYEYKYVVDGIWCCEPGIADGDYAGEGAVINAFGTKNRLIEIK